MRYREPFTVFPRKMRSGRTVWYYQTYDNKNRRTTARSTGQTSKGAARVYCNKLFKEDALIPNRGGNITFAKYSENWWVWDKCEYVRYRLSRRELSRTYIDSSSANLRLNILPYFGKMKLEAITNYDIEKWLSSFAFKGLSNLTANINLSCLNIMLTDAIRRGLLDSNPADNVSPLKKDARKKDILTADEVSLIFNHDSIEKLWKKKIYYLANLLSACTGLRIGEILAVRGEVLFDGYVLVSKQYNSKYGLVPTKTRDSRQVPVPSELQKELDVLNKKNDGGYIFSTTGGDKPISYQVLTRALKYALTQIGIEKEEQTRRYLCFHGWRHFFNTTMRTNNISDGKLQKLTGHKSMAMTERYTHFKIDDFQDVQKIQAKILQMPRKVG
ncbi:MAG: tyrosine-type recombinase/integrase [Spirochaetia bacterium]|jgi:integrase|nr:tyrosine-type recombinase/integrase [Spirochaetia bacterium]